MRKLKEAEEMGKRYLKQHCPQQLKNGHCIWFDVYCGEVDHDKHTICGEVEKRGLTIYADGWIVPRKWISSELPQGEESK